MNLKIIMLKIKLFKICDATDPQPRIRWYENGDMISNIHIDHGRFTIIDNNGVSMLRIEPILMDNDNAMYMCTAANGVGETIEAKAFLTTYGYGIYTTPAGNPSTTVKPLLIFSKTPSEVVENHKVSTTVLPIAPSDLRITKATATSVRLEVRDENANVFAVAYICFNIISILTVVIQRSSF